MPDPAELPSGARNAAASASATTGVFPTHLHRYRAFISYSHADTSWANWLLKRLEGYRVPARFLGRAAPIGEVSARIAPVFRDRDELATTSDLGETIRAALRESATLVVICSPNSAKSRWVLEEIKSFKRLHGERRVFAFIVSGEPKHEGAADDCFSPALRRELGADGELSGPPAEVVAADARPHGDGKNTAFLRLVSGLLGVGFDELRQRELQRRNRRLTLIAAASVAGMVLTLGLALAAWRARGEALVARNEAMLARNDAVSAGNDAQRRQEQAEDVLSFMLGDFRTDLKKVGQLSLLDRVGDKAMDYFARADARDLTDTALARKAKALTQIGEIRLDQKDVRFAEAEKAFHAGYEFAAALASRHPRSGDMLFERAQAEFWIGAVRRRAGDFAGAVEWMTRYRDSTMALVALDPANLKWRTELIAGRHNLAVLDVDRGALAAARSGFLAEMESVRAMAALEPKKSKWPYRMMDIHSYLGVTAERLGELAESRREFAAQVAIIDQLIAADSNNADLQFKYSDALTWTVVAEAVAGNLGEARIAAHRGIETMQKLLRGDPNNRRWVASESFHRIWIAQLDYGADRSAAEHVIDDESARLEALLGTEATDPIVRSRTVMTLRLKLHWLMGKGVAPETSLVARAIRQAELLVAVRPVSDRILGEAASTLVVAGQVAEAVGQPEAAKMRWQQAVDLLAAQLTNSGDWRLLDPAARALALLGRTAESGELVARLERIGYVPLEPFPVRLNNPTK